MRPPRSVLLPSGGRVRVSWPPWSVALVALSVGNLILGATLVGLAWMASYGRFPKAGVDAGVSAFIVLGIGLFGYARRKSTRVYGAGGVAALALATATGFLAMALLCLLVFAFLSPPIR